MRLRDQYDWVILGDHPGALLSGCLSARLGLAVLILPMVPSMRASISDEGQAFDPESNFILGAGRFDRSNGILLECLQRLGMSSSEGGKFIGESILPQVVTPQFRVQLQAGNEDFRKELDRELGEDLVAALGLPAALGFAESESLNYWKRLPDRLTFNPKPGGGGRKTPEPSSLEALRQRLEKGASSSGAQEKFWFQKDRSSRDLATRFSNPAMEDLLRGFWYGISGTQSQSKALSLAEMVHLFALARTASGMEGGVTAFRELLLRMAERLGVHIPAKAECKRIFIEKGRFVGVQIANQGNVIGARGGVVGCALSHAKERMVISGRNWVHRLKASNRPDGWKFTLALTVHAEAIPPGLSRRTIWQEPGAPALEIEVADPSEYQVDEPESRILFMRTLLPFRQETLDVGYQRVVAARMMRQLTELIPFLEYHVARVYPDFRVENDQFDQAYGFASIDLIPDNLRVYSGTGLGSRSGIEGLFLANNEAFPWVGSLGPSVAAIEATAWLAHRSGLSGPFA